MLGGMCVQIITAICTIISCCCCHGDGSDGRHVCTKYHGHYILLVVGGEHIAMAMVAHSHSSGHCVYKVMPEKHTHPEATFYVSTSLSIFSVSLNRV